MRKRGTAQAIYVDPVRTLRARCTQRLDRGNDADANYDQLARQNFSADQMDARDTAVLGRDPNDDDAPAHVPALPPVVALVHTCQRPTRPPAPPPAPPPPTR